MRHNLDLPIPSPREFFLIVIVYINSHLGKSDIGNVEGCFRVGVRFELYRTYGARGNMDINIITWVAPTPMLYRLFKVFNRTG